MGGVLRIVVRFVAGAIVLGGLMSLFGSGPAPGIVAKVVLVIDGRRLRCLARDRGRYSQHPAQYFRAMAEERRGKGWRHRAE